MSLMLRLMLGRRLLLLLLEMHSMQPRVVRQRLQDRNSILNRWRSSNLQVDEESGGERGDTL